MVDSDDIAPPSNAQYVDLSESESEEGEDEGEGEDDWSEDGDEGEGGMHVPIRNISSEIG